MSRYPEIRAGQRITGELLTGMQFEEIVKQSGTSRNTATMTADPELQFQLEANAVYYVEWHINYVCGKDRFKVDWIVPSGATGLKRVLGPDHHGTNTSTGDPLSTDAEGVVRVNAGDGGVRLGVHGFGTDIWYGGRPDGNQVTFTETGTVITGGTAGTLALSWSKVAATDGAEFATVASYSYARLKRVS